jgi:hypothetical protein
MGKVPMKLFSTTHISWNEPTFFLLRIREAWAWRIRLLLALALSVVVFGAMYFFQAEQRGLPEIIGVSIAAGFVIVALFDVGNIQREVTVKEDCIIVSSPIGRGWAESFNFDAINSIDLMRPEDWSKPYSGMLIHSTDDNYLVAIPKKVSLTALANILNRLEAAVTLSDWEPSDTDTRIGVTDQMEIDPASVRGGIEIQPIEAEEGPLLPPVHFAVQIVIALGPLLLALIAAIVAGVKIYRGWDELTVLDKSLYGGGAFAGIVVAFIYMIKVGQFIAASYGIGVAKKYLQTRSNALFGGVEDDLVTVEIFDRESWTAVVSSSSDFGFLQIDRPQSRLLFEGNKFRWTLPIPAISTCRIEESLVGSEGNPNAEKRYFVVIEATNQGEPWEAGMVYTRTEMGNDTPESRYKRAQLLFTQLAEVL